LHRSQEFRSSVVGTGFASIFYSTPLIADRTRPAPPFNNRPSTGFDMMKSLTAGTKPLKAQLRVWVMAIEKAMVTG
jgi:hypothetical protein